MALLVDAAFSGVYGGAYRLRVTVDVASVDAANNRTLITYNAWMEQVGSSAYSVFNSSTSGNTNINGYNPARGGSLSLNGPGQQRFLAQNEQYWIDHDSNGDANPFFGANYNTGVSQVGSSSGGTNYAMPHIDRFAAITGFGISAVTDTSFTVSVSTSPTCNILDYSLDGGSNWVNAVTGDFTSTSFTLSGLASNTAFNVIVRVRRSDNNLYTTSGSIGTTTGSQNNFFDGSGL